MKTTTLEMEEGNRLRNGEDPEAPPETSVREEMQNESREPDHQQIAELAYWYWCDRGRPDGSPEEDWFRAEGDLKRGRERERADKRTGGRMAA
jgi:hypothetical protein